jgi:hypothetical protein
MTNWPIKGKLSPMTNWPIKGESSPAMSWPTKNEQFVRSCNRRRKPYELKISEANVARLPSKTQPCTVSFLTHVILNVIRHNTARIWTFWEFNRPISFADLRFVSQCGFNLHGFVIRKDFKKIVRSCNRRRKPSEPVQYLLIRFERKARLTIDKKFRASVRISNKAVGIFLASQALVSSTTHLFGMTCPV